MAAPAKRVTLDDVKVYRGIALAFVGLLVALGAGFLLARRR